MCRVLSIGRTAYMALATAFPLSAEQLLNNLMEAAQEVSTRLELGGTSLVRKVLKELGVFYLLGVGGTWERVGRRSWHPNQRGSDAGDIE